MRCQQERASATTAQGSSESNNSYAAGHRSVHGRSLPLKRGMIKYAYTRKLPVQIVIGANKESILSEKHHTARFGQTAAVGYSGGDDAR